MIFNKKIGLKQIVLLMCLAFVESKPVLDPVLVEKTIEKAMVEISIPWEIKIVALSIVGAALFIDGILLYKYLNTCKYAAEQKRIYLRALALQGGAQQVQQDQQLIAQNLQQVQQDQQLIAQDLQQVQQDQQLIAQDQQLIAREQLRNRRLISQLANLVERYAEHKRNQKNLAKQAIMNSKNRMCE